MVNSTKFGPQCEKNQNHYFDKFSHVPERMIPLISINDIENILFCREVVYKPGQFEK